MGTAETGHNLGNINRGSLYKPKIILVIVLFGIIIMRKQIIIIIIIIIGTMTTFMGNI